MPKFIKKLIDDFLNIYLDEQDIRDSYGDEYADRFSVFDPVTGKKQVSIRKVFMRIVIVFLTLFFLFLMIRLMTYDSIWK